ncbi:MAG: histidine--tRNA ligase [Chitinophagales bacterium]|nr:histidine--tRNA ligase [Chitinophagales bacterium]
MKTNTNPAEGMRDIMPKENELRNYVATTIINTYKQFGFTQIETPSVERIQYLTSGDGGDNEKMLFKILKRGEKLNLETTKEVNDLVDLGLRYDLTVPLCRFYANNRAKLPTQFKAIQIGSVWRAERPQKGRFRQFTQCDIDIIGVSSILAETQLIIATTSALQQLGFSKFKVRINDRRILETLVSYCGFAATDFEKVFITLDKLDKIGIEGVKQELINAAYESQIISKFISIVQSTLTSTVNENTISDLLPTISEDVLSDLKQVIQIIQTTTNNNFSIQFDLSLVRGMGYYTGQIFEIGIEGYSSSIAGGGRYNKMIAKILNSKEDIPACGFSIGFERVISILDEQQFKVPTEAAKIVILFSDENNLSQVLKEASTLRANGNIVSIEIHNKKNTKKQLDDLKAQGFTAFAIFQLNETLNLKSLS